MAPQAILLFSFIMIFLSSEIHAAIYVTNNCPFTIWPGALAEGGDPEPSSTGFELAKGARYTLDIPAPWAGQVWARTGCAKDDLGKFTCATGDCGTGSLECKGLRGISPVTLVQFNLKDGGKEDYYAVSLVYGYNLPVLVTPQGGSGACSNCSCPHDVNKVCPPELAEVGPDGAVIACKSACLALGKPQYCCSGAFSSAETCPPTKYSKIFKGQCPQAKSYVYDRSGSSTCSGGPSYAITFCP